MADGVMGRRGVPLLGQIEDPLRAAQRESRRRARLMRRWHDRGPRASERWAYRAPWRSMAVTALMVGFMLGRTYRQWAEPSIGVVGETPWAVARTLIAVLLTVVVWVRLRADAALYAEWSGEQPREAGASRWSLVVVIGVAAAVLPSFVSLPERPAPPPDSEAIGRAVAGSTAGYELVDGQAEATGAHELSLVEEGLERWFVATRDADGACHALMYVDAVHERTEPLGAPCTGEHARGALG